MNKRFLNKRGFSLSMDIIAYITISAFLISAIAVASVNGINNSRKVVMESDLRVMAGDLENAINEIGLYPRLAGTEDATLLEDRYKGYLRSLEDNYMHTKFRTDSVLADESAISSLPYAEREEKYSTCLILRSDGFTVSTDKLDKWKMPIRVIYADSEDAGRVFMFVSAGPNTKFDIPSIDGLSDSTAHKFDDVVCIYKLKDSSIDRDVFILSGGTSI